MDNDLRELRVFMASPSDLGDERDALRDLERRLNAMFRHRRVRVSIEGWEEIQPDAGPPQELINPLVHECHIFIGLLNRRWGTPTDNDSSGFSEEFKIALTRRSAGDAPVIGMFFREIEPDRLRDKGPQLEAVLAFKERVQAERLLLFKEFNNADQLALEIMNFLLPQVMSFADEIVPVSSNQAVGASGSVPAETEPKSLEAAETNTENENDSEAAGLDSAQRQVVAALAAFSQAFSTTTQIDAAARDRVTLAAAAFAQDDTTLGTHHVNRLFDRREELDLTGGEIRIWYRTFLENYGSADRDYRTVPIWGVVHSDARFISDITSLASDENSAVVRGVLRLITDHRIRPDALWKPDEPDESSEGFFLESRTTASVTARWVRLFGSVPGIAAALNYVVSVARPEDAAVLAAALESEEFDERSRDLVKFVIESLNGNSESLVELAPTRYSGESTSAVRDLVIQSMPDYTPKQWTELLSGSHREIATAAALQIVEHEPVSAEQLELILELKSSQVEDAIVARGHRDAEWAEVQIRFLNELDEYEWAHLVSRLLAGALSKEMLENMHQEEEVTATAWVALTIQNPGEYVDPAREVLDGTADWLNQRTDPLMEKHAAVARYTGGTAKAAACAVLSTANEISDADVHRVARELRRDYAFSRGSALRALLTMVERLDQDPARSLPDLGDLSILDRFRNAEDVERVLAGPLAESVVPRWRESGVQTLQDASRAWELQRSAVTVDELEEALYLEDQRLRMVAVDELLAAWPDAKVADLLGRYSNQNRPYWYNVIAALDAHLYGYGHTTTQMEATPEDVLQDESAIHRPS